MECESDTSDISEYKPYREKVFSNSDDLPFGLTLKGKARSFVLAHETLRNVIIKGKSLKIGNSSIKFVDVDRNSKLINAVAEVSDVDNGKGHAEMKVYIPSHKKRENCYNRDSEDVWL